MASPYSPLYPLCLLFVIAMLGWVVSLVIPFYRKEVAFEGEARSTPIDGLRGILCFCVLCQHGAQTYGLLTAGEWKLQPSGIFAVLGQTAVSLFFCITAFLFWGRAVKNDGVIHTFPFFRGRFFRLVPLYLVSCLYALGIAASMRRIHWISGSAFKGLWKMALLGLRQWGNVGPVDMNRINCGVVWSLQYEWAFYLLLPALALIVSAGRNRLLWLVFAGLVVLVGTGPAMSFFPGILAVYVVRMPVVSALMRRRAVSVGIVLVAMLLPHLAGRGREFAAVLAIAAVFVPIACGNSLFGILNNRGLRLCGIVSYSVYLLHGMVLHMAWPALIRLNNQLPHGVTRYWLGMTAVAAATLGVSLLTYRFVEWPFMRFEKALRGRPRVRAVVRDAAVGAV